MASGVFRKEGEYWTVGYGGKSVRLKDTVGLGYLAHLLRHPAVEFHVLDLFGGIASRREEGECSQSVEGLAGGGESLEKAGIHITTLGDAGEMLDEQAKVAYKRRLSELRGELADAKKLANVDRAEQAEREIDALTSELSRAVGLGGRNRRAASASERARQSITKSIKSVIERIARNDAALGSIFSRSVKTGNFCCYQPDPDISIAWEFAATGGGFGAAPADNRLVPPAMLEASPFSLAERAAFVGREYECDAIRAAIDRALNGQASVVLLGGGPGVGKSRLAAKMAEYASRIGFRCVVGHCYEREEPLPFLPFVEIIESVVAQTANLDDLRRRLGDNAAELAQIAPRLRRVFPDIPQPLELPPAQRRHYLFQSLAEVMERAARRRSQLIVLEDLHWADESALALLAHLANRLVQLPFVIIGTYRDGYSENNPALSRTLEELIRMGIRPLKLRGLSKEAVAQMLHGLTRRQAPESLVSLVFEESEGYPFFVEEVYRHLIEEGEVFDATGQFHTDLKIGELHVPGNVRLIIGRRLERLDENEKRVLVAAAVVGRSFSFRLLTAVSQIDVDELFDVIEKAQQMGIIVPSAEGPEQPFTFTHELVRQTLLAGISVQRQQRLHVCVADAIERLYPAAVQERAGEIADHLRKAGPFADAQRMVRWLTLAGEGALQAAAFKEARNNFRSALSHLDTVGTKNRADLFASLAIAEQSLERWEVAVAILREALEIYISLGDRKMIAGTFTELVDALSRVGRFQEATETARRGLSYLPADMSADRARLLAALARALAGGARYESAQDALGEALNIASQLSDPKLTANVLSVRSVMNVAFFRLKEAAEDGFRSQQLAGSEAPPWQRALQLRILLFTLLYLGRPEEALRIGDELEPLARKIGESYSLVICGSTRVWAEFGRAPDLAKFGTDLQRVLKTDQEARIAHWEALSEVLLSQLDFLRGNWADALSHAQVAHSAEPGSSTEGFGVGTLFRQLAYTGDRDGACAVLDEKRAWLPLSGQANTFGSWIMLALVIEGFAILGERSQAAQLYPLARELICTGAVTLWPIFRFSHTSAGVAAAAAGEWEAAEDHFQIALPQAESFPNLLEQADIRRFHAMMLLERGAQGDRQKARALLNEALETYRCIGMPRHIAMTQTLLGRAASASRAGASDCRRGGTQ